MARNKSKILSSIGLEGALGVTAMAVSNISKRYLAVCEEAKHALCIVYDLHTLKRKKILTSSEIHASKFIDVKFGYSEEKLTNFLVTLVSLNPLLFNLLTLFFSFRIDW